MYYILTCLKRERERDEERQSSKGIGAHKGSGIYLKFEDNDLEDALYHIAGINNSFQI